MCFVLTALVSENSGISAREPFNETSLKKTGNRRPSSRSAKPQIRKEVCD